jgi:hypothetical protein
LINVAVCAIPRAGAGSPGPCDDSASILYTAFEEAQTWRHFNVKFRFDSGIAIRQRSFFIPGISK